MGSNHDSHRLLVGVGGTGKSTLLKTWADEVKDREITWLTGNARRLLSAEKLTTALEGTHDIVVLDELQWFSTDALEVLADRVERLSISIWASKRPWPASEPVNFISSVLTKDSPPTMVGLLPQDELRPVVAQILDGPVKAEVTTWLHQHTSGSVGLCADILNSGWHIRPEDPMPDQLTYLLNQRVSQCDAATETLARLLALGPELSIADGANALVEPHDQQAAEHGLRSSGLLTPEAKLTQPVAEAIRASITSQTRAELFSWLAQAERDPIKAGDYARQGSGSDQATVDILIAAAEATWWSKPQKSIDLVEAALRIDGSSDSAAGIEQAAVFRLGQTIHETTPTPSTQLGHAVRNMRWQQAISIADADNSCQALIDLLLAETAPPAMPTAGTIEGDTTIALRQLVDGKQHEALTLFSTAASDYDRVTSAKPSDSFLLAFNPHRLGALAASAVGDIDAARILVRKAISSPTIEPAEHRTFELLAAYCNLARGEYREALAITNSPQSAPDASWTLREQLLWSSLNAGLARRSGDTTRMRDAWGVAEGIILEVSPSWVYLELLHDVIVAGARLGELDRIRPVLDELTQQAKRVGGDVGIAASWLQLNVALASKDAAVAADAVGALTKAKPVAKRLAARCVAGQLWIQIMANQRGEETDVDEKAVLACAEQVAADADPWQASRLLGQAALDEKDPKAARRLLERARDVVTEVGNVVSNNFGDLGLSDREAEVALLVGQGHAYKKIGERLYISPKTVEHHVARIRQKLGASSRADMLKKINSRME